MKSVLKLFPLEMLIHVVVEILASTVKNPASDKARNLLEIVRRLRDASTRFIDTVESNL